MLITRYPRLGVLPAAMAVESAWAWYDPDLFMDLWWEADQEQQVTNLSEQWYMLDLTASKTLPWEHDAYVELRSNIANWNKWKQQYHDAVLRRWIPFQGRDWGDELLGWFGVFKSQASKVATAGGELAQRELARQGYEETLLPEPDKGILEQATELVERAGEEAQGAAGRAGSGFFWPAMALGASAALLLWGLSWSRKRPVRT